MPQLTEEYLDNRLIELTKDFKGYVDQRIGNTEQKFEKAIEKAISDSEEKIVTSLGNKIIEETENLARIVNKGFEHQRLQFVDLFNRHDERIEHLEKDMRKVKDAIMMP